MLAEINHRFLFEVRPDVFPEGYLTIGEMELWARYYEDQAQRRKSANG